MSGKPLSGERRRWLLEELESWQTQGLISQDQRFSILNQYESGADLDARQGNRAIAVLMALAAFMVGLAVLLFIGFNWEILPDFVKLGLIFGSLIGSHALGERLQRQNAGMSKVHAAHFFGCFLYGCGIWLVAQIFHLSAHYPDGCWWWAIGILPFAVLLDSFAIHVLLVAILAIWCGQEVLGFPDLGGWLFGRWRWLPNAAWTLPLFATPGLVQIYRQPAEKNAESTPSSWKLRLYLALITWWFYLLNMAAAVSWHWRPLPIYGVGAVGVLLLVLGELHRQGDPRKIPYREFGGILIATVLMLTSFYGFNQEMLRGSWWGGYRHETPQVPLDLFAIAVSGLTIVLGVLGLQRAKQGAKTAEAVAQRRQFYLPIALGAAWAGVSLWTALLHDPLTPTILANLGMLALSWWLTQTGLREDRGRPFAAGIGYFLLWTVIRYIDLFGDLFGILGGAGMFFVCGATLYAVASYWQKRVKAQVPPTSRPNETWSVD